MLILEGSPPAASGLRDLLELDGWSAVCARDQGSALQVLADRSIGAAVVDLALAVDGFVPRALAARPELCIFVLATFEGARGCTTVLEQGARAVLVKPIDYELFHTTLGLCLGRAPI